MSDLRLRVQAQFENITETLSRFPDHGRLNKLSILELAGVAALLHNFYNGMENILKQLIIDQKLKIPTGQSWHRDLLELALTKKIISNRTGKYLKQYLAFRHFFSHGYALDLDCQRLLPLVRSAGHVFDLFQKDVKRYLAKFQ